MNARVLSLAVACLASSACFRTVYRNLQPPNQARPAETPETLKENPGGGWQHFFIWGLLPVELTIDAAALCGGAEHVASIQTRRTPLQRAITVVLERHISLYSPYNGRVTCDHSRRD